jgi:hypothetical protein
MGRPKLNCLAARMFNPRKLRSFGKMSVMQLSFPQRARMPHQLRNFERFTVICANAASSSANPRRRRWLRVRVVLPLAAKEPFSWITLNPTRSLTRFPIAR